MSQSFNYRHLYYFWVVAREGGLMRAAERLDMAVQTISAQVRALEQDLGHALFKPGGRRLVLTEAGVAALREADHIFELGQGLQAKVREAASGQSLRFVIGISDGVAKLAVHRLLQQVLDVPHLRLLCEEGEFDELLADLALHKLDAVIADRAPAAGAALRLQCAPLASNPLAWYAPPELAKVAAEDFPRSLTHVPVLLPNVQGALRARLDHWFERLRIKPRIVGEFEDSALLTTFGAAGFGIFPAAEWLDDYLVDRLGLCKIAVTAELMEHVFLISTERKVMHPLLTLLLRKSDAAS